MQVGWRTSSPRGVPGTPISDPLGDKAGRRDRGPADLWVHLRRGFASHLTPHRLRYSVVKGYDSKQDLPFAI
jgi:hypothetical protein